MIQHLAKAPKADYSAITTWGVFETEADGQNIILT